MKQDIVPGMTQFAWFNSRDTGEIEIMCTELCGWGHYQMKADFRLVDRSTFDQWIAEQTAANLPQYKAETTRNVAQSKPKTELVVVKVDSQTNEAHDD